MADFFFFTDLNSNITQTQAQAFGPIDNLNYNVENQFTVTANAPAIAVLRSIPFVQQCTENADCVNVILLPLDNPDFDFPEIKFFVYRGIKKSSLFGDDNIINADYSDWKADNILKVLYDLQAEINNQNEVSGDSAPKPTAENIGYHYSVVGGDFFEDAAKYVESVIFSNDEVQLPVVNAGCQIGQFVGGSTLAGFQVIQDRLGYEPKLGEVRAATSKVTITATLGTQKSEIFEHWHQKEAILTYVDAAAFYGCAKANGKKVRAYNGDTSSKQDGETIVNLFYNKEVVYLDIRNDQNYSYDYYDNFGKTVRLSFEENEDELTSESVNYYFDWPLLRIENKKLFEKNSKSKFAIELPFYGISDDTSKYYLSSFTQEFLSQTQGKTKIHRLNQFDNETKFLVGYSEMITFFNWVNEPGNLGANYYLLKYSLLEYAFCEGTLRNAVLDTLFSLDMRLLIGDDDLTDGDFKTYVYSSVNAPIVDKSNEMDDSQDVYIPKIGIAKDKHHVTFFAFKDKVEFSANGESLGYPFSIVQKGEYKNAVYLNEFDYDPNFKSLGFLAALPKRSLSKNLTLKRVTHPFPKGDSDEDRQYLYFLNSESKPKGSFYIDPRTFDCITISIEEYEMLLQNKESNHTYRTYIKLQEDDFHNNGRYRINEMSLGLKSVKPDNTRNFLEKVETFIEGAEKITLNGLVTKA